MIGTPIVGLEIHVELNTRSKMFCGCTNDPFHAPKPNMYTCPVCLGMPGGLPVPNKRAIEWTILLGTALFCDIALESKFDRKNYFYPDLAKGYQISQYDEPIATDGKLTFPVGDPTKGGYEKTVRIRRVHLEEDTGKLLHQTVDGKKVTLIDFNRSGVPLVEIVTEPDIRSGDEAKAFLKALHQIIRYLGISTADMEKGSMRLEPNISIMLEKPSDIIDEKDLPKYKVEVKNINSFTFVKKAIDFETERHTKLLEAGQIPPQETRGWNEDKGITFSQRLKEDAHDYRYFPDPDIPPLVFDQDMINTITAAMPELPQNRRERFQAELGLPFATAATLIDSQELADFFEKCIAIKGVDPKQVANWLVNKHIDNSKTTPEKVVEEIIAKTTVVAVSEDTMNSAIQSVLSQNAQAVADYKAGKTQVKMFLFGQVLKALQGKGDKTQIQKLLEKELGN